MKLLMKPVLAALACSTGLLHAAALVVVNAGGANGDAQRSAYVEPFQKAIGQKVVVVEWNQEMGKLKAMVESKKVSWNVVEIESGDIGRACEEGILEKIDMSKIGKQADFLPAAMHECGIGMFVWSKVMAYNGDVMKTPPTNWADFWNVKKFPGKRGMRKGAHYNLEFALMADGVATKDVYTVLATKEGVARAFKKLDELRPHIQWWEAGAQPPQFLVAGDVVMTTAYNGRIDAAQREGRNLQVVWTGSMYDLDYWSIPKGASNKAAAEQFIAYASSAEAQKNYSTRIAYGPVNIQALKLLDDKVLTNLPTSPKNIQNAMQMNLQFWTDQGEELEKRFAAWAAR